MRHPYIYIMAVALALSSSIAATAQTTGQPQALSGDTLQDALHQIAPAIRQREYTQERPLVYEGSWDLWPYTFLNVMGEPDGYSVDLVRLILDRLNIPYVIKLKPQPEVFNDLKEGRSDLMLGIAAGFHDQYGHYGRTAITLFTQSVATPKSEPVEIETFSDLASHHVIVNAGSLAYHLMQNQGWGDNATVTTDITESMLKVSNQNQGAVLWNDLGLKWLVKRYQLDNLEITPVNMPHGEYKFMSNDTRLLAHMDSVYALLNSEEKIIPLQNKWFYPERRETATPGWVWQAIIVTTLLLIVLVIYIYVYRMKGRRVNQENNKRYRRLALILETSGVHIWTFDVKERMFTWRNENGQAAYNYTPEEFSQRYSPEDYKQLRNAILRLAATPKPDDGKEEEVKLSIRAKDIEEGSNEMRNYTIMLSVLRRSSNGKAAVIIGTKKDITESIRLQQQTDDRAKHYRTLFNTPLVGIMYFNKYGLLTDINEKACEMYDCQAGDILAKSVSIYDMLSIGSVDIDEIDGMYATKDINLAAIPGAGSSEQENTLHCEYNVLQVNNEENKPIGFFAIARKMLATLLLILGIMPATAQSWKQKFTPEHPLIIVGDWDKPPYEFLNRNGEPSGTNVESMDLVFKEMGVPYKYVLKDWNIAMKMFERGDADIILAYSTTYRDSNYVFSQNIINYNRIVAASMGESNHRITLHELLHEGVVLRPFDYSSYFFRNADSTFAEKVVYQSTKVALTGLTDSIYKYFVWGEEPLKWKIREYNLEGIVLNEVQIPVSDIFIIGHDRELVEAMDDHYSRLKQSGQIQAIIDKWLHPEQLQKAKQPFYILVIGGILLLLVTIYLFNLLAKRHVKMITRKSVELNNMMTRALHMGNFDVTVYDIKHDLVTNNYGHLLPDEGITVEEFAEHIHPKEQEEFHHRLERLLNGRDKKFELNKHWKDYNGNWLFLQGHAIVEADEEGHPRYIINAVHDVTRDEQQEMKDHEIACQYRLLTHLPPAARALFDGKTNFATAFDDIFELLKQRTAKAPVKLTMENPYDTFLTRIDVSRVQKMLTDFVDQAVALVGEGTICVGYRYEKEKDGQPGGLHLYCEATATGNDGKKGSTSWCWMPCERLT